MSLDELRARCAEIAQAVADEAPRMKRTAYEAAVLIRDRILQTEFEEFNQEGQ